MFIPQCFYKLKSSPVTLSIQVGIIIISQQPLTKTSQPGYIKEGFCKIPHQTILIYLPISIGIHCHLFPYFNKLSRIVWWG